MDDKNSPTPKPPVAAKRGRGPDKRKRKKQFPPPKAGPGRPKGSKDVLPRGAVGAIKALRWRVPETAPEEVKDIADEAFNQIVEVMRGKLGRQAMHVLNASKATREEICGPLSTKVEHSGGVNIVVKTGVTRGLDERD